MLTHWVTLWVDLANRRAQQEHNKINQTISLGNCKMTKAKRLVEMMICLLLEAVILVFKAMEPTNLDNNGVLRALIKRKRPCQAFSIRWSQ